MAANPLLHLPAPPENRRRGRVVKLLDHKAAPKPLKKKRAAAGTGVRYEEGRAWREKNKKRLAVLKQKWVDTHRTEWRAYRRVWMRQKRGGTTARQKRGEAHYCAKMDAGKVTEMRKLRAAGKTVEALAAEFGVSKASASNITRGLSWAHVPMPE